MNPSRVKTGVIVVFSIIVLIAGFYMFNNYIYKQKQGNQITQPENKSEASTFVWRYEQADSLNLDGVPNTNIFLEVKYENGETRDMLIATTPGSCNDLPEVEDDSLPNTTNIQCYGAGLGYKFKITKGETAYLVQRKTFEEGLPDYTPPAYEYEVVLGFPFYI